METQQAEIASSADSAKVDSAATDAGTEVSATSGAETTAAENNGATAAESPEKKRDDVQERFDKLTRERYEAQARAEIAEERRAALEARLAALEQEKAKPSQVAPDALPTLESVGYDEQKFVSVLSQHFEKIAKEQGKAAAQEAFNEYQAQQSRQTAKSDWAKREAEFIKSQPDYVDKVQKAQTLPISTELQEKLMQLDDGPQIALHLVDNREKAFELLRLPIEFQMMEVGRIRGELAAKKAAPPVSKAPPPVVKVDANNAPSSFKVDSAESDQLSDAEWTRRRNAQEAARRRKVI